MSTLFRYAFEHIHQFSNSKVCMPYKNNMVRSGRGAIFDSFPKCAKFASCGTALNSSKPGNDLLGGYLSIPINAEPIALSQEAFVALHLFDNFLFIHKRQRNQSYNEKNMRRGLQDADFQKTGSSIQKARANPRCGPVTDFIKRVELGFFAVRDHLCEQTAAYRLRTTEHQAITTPSSMKLQNSAFRLQAK